MAGSVSCERERLFSEKANGSLSDGLKEEAKRFSLSEFLCLLIETCVKNENAEVKEVKPGSRKLRKSIASSTGLNSHICSVSYYITISGRLYPQT